MAIDEHGLCIGHVCKGVNAIPEPCSAHQRVLETGFEIIADRGHREKIAEELRSESVVRD